jgi:flagellar export protein FliJ
MAEITELGRRTSVAGECNMSLLIAAQRHKAALLREQQATAEQLELVQNEIDRRRSVLAAAEQQVRVLEKLSEKKVQDAVHAADRREAKRLDELATIRHSTEAGSFGYEVGESI